MKSEKQLTQVQMQEILRRYPDKKAAAIAKELNKIDKEWQQLNSLK